MDTGRDPSLSIRFQVEAWPNLRRLPFFVQGRRLRSLAKEQERAPGGTAPTTASDCGERGLDQVHGTLIWPHTGVQILRVAIRWSPHIRNRLLAGQLRSGGSSRPRVQCTPAKEPPSGSTLATCCSLGSRGFGVNHRPAIYQFSSKTYPTRDGNTGYVCSSA